MQNQNIMVGEGHFLLQSVSFNVYITVILSSNGCGDITSCPLLLRIIVMDWKTSQKPINFHENRRNRSRPVSPIFGKPADQIWNLKKLKKFEIKILKKLESISIFLVKQNSKNQSHESYKIRWSQNRRGNREKRKWPVPYKGATLGPYPQAPDLILHPRPPSSMPPPLDFDVFHRCATGPVYRLGLVVNQSY
jgi:hypothetical protein